jgi:transcription termination factor Rho
MLDLPELKKRTVQELRKMAEELGVEKTSGLKKHDLCLKILVAQSEQNGHRYGYGILDIVADGRGFLRVDERKQKPLTDIYVADTQIKRFNLRGGDLVSGPVRPPKDNERYWSLLRVQTINEREPSEARNRPHFEDLVPIYPNERLRLETKGPDNITGRFMDLVTPIGRGQRGLIIAPPKAGRPRSSRRSPMP